MTKKKIRKLVKGSIAEWLANKKKAAAKDKNMIASINRTEAKYVD